MRGIVSDIVPFSVHDGPGIRTTVFFKGCPLRCRWCHNPENWRPGPQCMVLPSRCMHCGACSVCPAGARGPDGAYDSARCTGCGRCAALCPAGACRISGAAMTPEEVVARILPDKPFFRDRGGVTLSGGEPMYQPDFAIALATLLREEGIDVALETCGYAAWADLRRMVPLVSRFLYDWKESDPEKHRRWTGADNRLIRENLARLNDAGTRIVLRCPLIPGCNDREDHFEGIAKLTRRYPAIERVDLLPYHALGNDKRTQLGLSPDGLTPPDEKTVRAWRERVQSLCSIPVG